MGMSQAPGMYSSPQLGPNVSIGKGVTVGEGVRLRESIVLHGATLQVCTLELGGRVQPSHLPPQNRAG